MVIPWKKILHPQIPTLLVFVSFFVLYLITTSHTVVQGDSGEFLAAAAVGGVPHEPGYPLYSFITRLLFLVSFENPPWLINAFSAFCGAVVVSLTYKITYIITKHHWTGLFAALILGFYESFWWYSLIAEVYALQLLLHAIITLLLLHAYMHSKKQYFYSASFVFGLGISNHFTIVFLFPLFLLVLFKYKQQFVKTVCIAGAAACLGLIPYLYTFYSASQLPLVNWGRVHDVSSFFRFVFRSDLGTFQFGPTEPPLPYGYYSFSFFFSNLILTSWYILPFFVTSFYWLYKKHRLISSLLFCWMLFGPVFFLLIAVPQRSIVHTANTTQYISYAYFFFAILAGIGLKKIFDIYHEEKLRIGAKTVFLTLVFCLVFAIPFFTAFQKVREDNNFAVEITAKQHISIIPKNGILLLWSDSLYFPALYLQHVKHYRTDITIIQLGLINTPWYQANLIQQYPQLKPYILGQQLDYKKICADFSQKNLIYMYPWYQEFDQIWQNAGCKQIPFGLIVKIIPERMTEDISAIKRFNDAQINTLQNNLGNTFKENKHGYYRKRETLFYLSEHRNYIGIYAMQEKNYDWALSSFQQAVATSADQTNAYIGMSALLHASNRDREAIAQLKEGISKNPTTSALYKNIAVLYQLQGDIPNAKENFSHYVSFSPDSDPDLPKILQFIQNN